MEQYKVCTRGHRLIYYMDVKSSGYVINMYVRNLDHFINMITCNKKGRLVEIVYTNFDTVLDRLPQSEKMEVKWYNVENNKYVAYIKV